MSDNLSPEQRSWNMSRISSRNTSIEMAVRKCLHSQGFRYRVNDRRYPGKPDIVLPKYKTAIFINGCFWHHHENCKYATVPKTRTEFWLEKFETNRRNDYIKQEKLREMGWKVIVIWECEIKHSFESRMKDVIADITGQQ